MTSRILVLTAIVSLMLFSLACAAKRVSVSSVDSDNFRSGCETLEPSLLDFSGVPKEFRQIQEQIVLLDQTK